MVRAMLAAAVVMGLVGCADPETSRLSPGQECVVVPAFEPGDPDYDPAEVTLAVGKDPLRVEGIPYGTEAIVVRDDEPMENGPFRTVLVRVESAGYTGAGEMPRVALRPVR